MKPTKEEIAILRYEINKYYYPRVHVLPGDYNDSENEITKGIIRSFREKTKK